MQSKDLDKFHPIFIGDFARGRLIINRKQESLPLVLFHFRASREHHFRAECTAAVSHQVSVAQHDSARMTWLDAQDCAALEARWSEPHRHYHGLNHLRECLARFAEVRALAQDAEVVEAALWFHDAIYDARRTDNEARSAALARTMLTPKGISNEHIARVEAIILTTRHAAPSADADTQLTCDIDLAILGADAERFDAYERDVRAEYAWVPMPIYRVKRAEILMRFLASPRIYQTAHFHALLNDAARDNLAHSLEVLRES